jgi:hypothetical protein
MRRIICKRKCNQCGIEFNVLTDGPNKHFCSRICFYQSRKKPYNFNCVICGNSFYRNNIEIKNNRLTCSKKCAKKRKQNIIDNKINNVKNFCFICGNILPYGNKKFCSRKCQLIFKEKMLGKGEYKSPDIIKKYLINERGYLCEQCLLSEWLGKPISLELHHIDGDSNNNNKNNLKLLCANCHSFTPTYRSKNKGKGRIRRRLK